MEWLDADFSGQSPAVSRRLQEAGTGCSVLGSGLAPGGSAGEAPFVYRGKKKNLGLPSNKWAGKEGREAASHFWAGFLAVLTHCDLKQFLFYPHPSVHPSRGAVTVLPPG